MSFLLWSKKVLQFLKGNEWVILYQFTTILFLFWYSITLNTKKYLQINKVFKNSTTNELSITLIWNPGTIHVTFALASKGAFFGNVVVIPRIWSIFNWMVFISLFFKCLLFASTGSFLAEKYEKWPPKALLHI